MPSSLIFIGLVVLWLLILVPMVARRQQEVARPSTAALSGRVLERSSPRRRTLEVDVDEMDQTRVVATRGRPRGAASRATGDGGYEVDGTDALPDGADRAGPGDHGPDGYEPDGYEPEEPGHDRPDDLDDRTWQRPASRYRPGRGGFDPEAAALAARARYGIRQRAVLGLVLVAAVTALVAWFVEPGVWWLHGGVVTALVGYLVYLRRQVRLEEEIRARRTSRLAGTRRPAAADDPELDGWADRGRVAARSAEGPDAAAREEAEQSEHGTDGDLDEDAPDPGADDDADRVAGTGEPLGMLPGRPRGAPDETDDAGPQTGLPRLPEVELPAVPAGTHLLEFDESDPDQHELGRPAPPDYRRAAGA